MSNVETLSIFKLDPEVYRSRLIIDPTTLQSLIKSITSKGIVSPIIVNKISPDKFGIIAGIRRYTAAKEMGLKEVLCLVKEIDLNQAYLEALIENEERQDYMPCERAQIYKDMIDKKVFASYKELAETVNKTQARVSQIIKLLDLDEKVQKVVGVDISETMALEIARVENHEDQVKLVNKILKDPSSFTVRKVKAQVDKKLGFDEKKAKEITNLKKDVTDKISLKVWEEKYQITITVSKGDRFDTIMETLDKKEIERNVKTIREELAL